jgi:hypothetical protein
VRPQLGCRTGRRKKLSQKSKLLVNEQSTLVAEYRVTMRIRVRMYASAAATLHITNAPECWRGRRSVERRKVIGSSLQVVATTHVLCRKTDREAEDDDRGDAIDQADNETPALAPIDGASFLHDEGEAFARSCPGQKA